MSIFLANAMTVIRATRLDITARALDMLALEDILVGFRSIHVLEKAVRRLAVNRVVADEHVVLGHAKRDSADVLDEQHDQARPDQVPANDEEGANNLDPDLSTVVVNGTTGVCETESQATFTSGKDSGQETTKDGSDQVSVRDSCATVLVQLVSCKVRDTYQDSHPRSE